jgi:SAM-dependent methyltransferase
MIPAYSPEPWVVVGCRNCAFVYLQNPPEYQALVSEFAWEKTYADKKAKGGSTALSDSNRRLRKRIGYRGRTRSERLVSIFGLGKVLDIGCGEGARIQPPLIPYGIELSAELHSQADAFMRSRGGYCLHAPGAEGLAQFESGFFDGVLMHSYLEHEINVQTTLAGAYQVLRPGGKVFVRVPNYGSINRRVIGPTWCGFRYPDHVNYFTYNRLRRMAEAVGFSTTLVNRYNLWLDDNVQALLHKPLKA